MNDRFEATTIDEVEEAVKRLNDFHDDYVAGIDIKFENYKGLDDEGVSISIGDADKTIILTVNTYPYGKEHNQFVRVEFKEVKSFEITSAPDGGPTWGSLLGMSRPARKSRNLQRRITYWRKGSK